MKRNFFFFSLFAFLLFACSKKPVEVPTDVLTKEQIIPVLVDIHLAQSAVTVYQYNDTLKYNINELTAAILKNKNVTTEKFKKSLKFYSDNPELMDEIYQQVISDLTEIQGRSMVKQ